MKVLILAGGFGTRLSEITELRPKPMVEIGEYPIIYHIMKIYSYYGYNDFVVLLGYKGYLLKEYFTNFFLHQNDVTIDLRTNKIDVHNNYSEDWKVTLLETGINTMTGGRIKRAKEYIGNEPFMCTYGDGVANINIKELVDFHRRNKKLMTITAIQPEGRYGALNIAENNVVTAFNEKPKGDNIWVNGGFFVCQPEVLDYIEGDHHIFEREPMERIASDNQSVAYKHHGFWHAMDTLRDNKKLNQLWMEGNAPWKLWS
jgi:glucose-1-phosphate cytidylyltransferase